MRVLDHVESELGPRGVQELWFFGSGSFVSLELLDSNLRFLRRRKLGVSAADNPSVQTTFNLSEWKLCHR